MELLLLALPVNAQIFPFQGAIHFRCPHHGNHSRGLPIGLHAQGLCMGACMPNWGDRDNTASDTAGICYGDTLS